MQVPGVIADVSLVIPFGGGLRSPEFRHFHTHSHSFSDSKSFISSGFFKSCVPILGNGIHKCQPRGLSVRASEGSSDKLVPVAPLQFESPAGQLLGQILQTHPHLLPAAIDQQLEKLQTERDAQKEETPTSKDPLYKVQFNINI